MGGDLVGSRAGCASLELKGALVMLDELQMPDVNLVAALDAEIAMAKLKIARMELLKAALTTSKEAEEHYQKMLDLACYSLPREAEKT